MKQENQIGNVVSGLLRLIPPALMAVTALEKGGPAKKGKPYLVGEKGPELFVPKKAGKVVPKKGRGKSKGKATRTKKKRKG